MPPINRPPNAQLVLMCLMLAPVTAIAQTDAELVSPPVAAASPSPSPTAEPFAFGDFTWMNGSNRQSKALLDMPYLTASALVDVNYSFAFNRPVDNTINGSTVTGRHNEVHVLLASFGADLHYKNVRGSITTQLGGDSTLVPPNDPSAGRGQYDLIAAFRYLREAYAGYHFNVWSGLNIDAGIFMSYIGLFSYLNFENWGYQPSYVSDNTPFFFQGIRVQAFPTERLKVELWVTNGWQSYAKYNQAPGLGYQVNYRPTEALSLVFNGYAGYDTAHTAGRLRLHSDNSLLVRYYNNPGHRFFNRAAVSITADIGGENGDGVSFAGRPGAPAQNFLGAMAYNRLWFAHDLFALTVGGGFIKNPGRYLVLYPTPSFPRFFDTSPGATFEAWDATLTFDWMPTELITFRLELVQRAANVPYFAGRGGVTSQNGWNDIPVAGFTPNLAKSETRLIGAMMVRL